MPRLRIPPKAGTPRFVPRFPCADPIPGTCTGLAYVEGARCRACQVERRRRARNERKTVAVLRQRQDPTRERQPCERFRDKRAAAPDTLATRQVERETGTREREWRVIGDPRRERVVMLARQMAGIPHDRRVNVPVPHLTTNATTQPRSRSDA